MSRKTRKPDPPPYTPGLTHAVLARYFGIHPREAQRLLSTLSKRHHRICGLAAMGWAVDKTARHLGILPMTVCRYRQAVKRWFDLDDLGGLARIWFAAQLGAILDQAKPEEPCPMI